jgi:hypothetical protein
MEARIERRAPDVPRIPLDVLVRLTHEDFEEPFDADGVDVSAGGLALRADYLPEVGDRLRCRFDCPPEGAAIEVDGEVVWAHDAGERSGEFGLRFTALDEHAERALTSLLAQVGEPDGERPTARLHLENVATPIDAEIVARGSGSLTVEQELPFLRLGMGVVVEGTGPAHGRLSGVGLRVEGGVPRLVLSVEQARAEAHVDEARVEPSSRIEASDDVAGWATAAPELTPSGDWQPDVVASEPDSTLQDYELPASLRAPEVDAVAHGEAAEEVESAPAGHRFELADEPAPAQAWGERAGLSRVMPVVARAREASVAALEKAKPLATAAWAKIVLFASKALETAGPGAKALAAKLGALASALWARAATTVARGKKSKRRTTAAPVRTTAAPPRLRRQRAEEPAPAPAKKSRRGIALAALAFVVVGALVYGLTRADAPVEEPVAVAAPPAPEPLPALPEPVAPVAAPTDPLAAPMGDPTLVAPAGALPAPETQAGRLDEPSYPSLRDAVNRPTTGADPAASAPTLAPTPSVPPGGSPSFGAADVPNGRTTTLRMSQPVAGIRGDAQPDGFTVTIPGALSLDRAGPIAATNPSIDQAMVLNRGDHAVLTVRFVAGRNPPYRVVARGAAIEVTIGR